MATRYVRRNASFGVEQIKFVRDDLLCVLGPIASPYTHETVVVPLAKGDYSIGPTILNMMVRKLVPCGDLPAALRPEGVKQSKKIAVWAFRSPDELWPVPAKAVRPIRENDDEEDGEEDVPDHPFVAKFVSGGVGVSGGPDGYQMVRKVSTINISTIIFRQAIRAFGGIGAAYSRIGRLAAESWAVDLERALNLWATIEAAGGLLVENDDVCALLPQCSVSQAVEFEIGRQVLVSLGEDPDSELSRKPGRPRAAGAGDQGEYLAMSIVNGSVLGCFQKPYRRIEQGTDLASIDTVSLAVTLGAFRRDGLDVDADMLEAYLDARDQDWRAQVADEAGGAVAPSETESPYDVMGVKPDMSMAEINAVLFKLREVLEPLPNSAAYGRVVAAYQAIKTMKKEVA